MARIVMFWDCPYCRTKKIPGYIRECVDGCGHPRPRKIFFYHSKPPTIASQAEEALFGKPDPNWYCEGCDSGNREEDSACWKCGTTRTVKSAVHEVRKDIHSKDLYYSAKEAEEIGKKIAPEPQKEWVPLDDLYNPQSGVPKNGDDSLKDYQEKSPYSIENNPSNPKRLNLKTSLIIGGVITGLVVLSLLVYNFFMRTHIEPVTVTDMNWSQSVHIEEYQTFHEGSWSIPIGGRQTSTEPRVSGQEKIHDGWTTEEVQTTCYRDVQVSGTCTGTRNVPDTCYTDNGDGSSTSYDCSYSESYDYSCTETESQSYSCTETQQVELYHYKDIISLWYFYDIDRWTTIGTYPTSGTGLEVFYDPVLPIGDKQRRIEDGGTYTVTFASDKVKPFSSTYDLATYLTFDIGQTHEAVVNFFKVILEVR
jgi:hypothetical protein